LEKTNKKDMKNLLPEPVGHNFFRAKAQKYELTGKEA